MLNSKNITAQRWFMGKNRRVLSVNAVDCISLGGATFFIVEVQFLGGEQDHYLLAENEECAGIFFREAFPAKAGTHSIQGSRGTFLFTTHKDFDPQELEALRPLSVEQSNSAFVVHGKFFFKIFRRLQAGSHPEEEILSYLNRIRYTGVPQLFASCRYENSNGKSFALGILESHLAQTRSAWDFFVDDPNVDAAFTLGSETARMHIALAKLKGCKAPSEEPPFEKLQHLLNQDCSGAEEASNSHREQLRQNLPRLKALWQDSTGNGPSPFAPQRIHGDLHLGQVLLQKKGPDYRWTIIDFEGEPSRTLEFRRGLRSPAADIAGMIRSFQYAEAVANKPSGIVQKSFMDGYAQAAGLYPDLLWVETKPYIIAKAVYEACYELEFRPDWFWIPAKALIQLANPGE